MGWVVRDISVRDPCLPFPFLLFVCLFVITSKFLTFLLRWETFIIVLHLQDRSGLLFLDDFLKFVVFF